MPSERQIKKRLLAHLKQKGQLSHPSNLPSHIMHELGLVGSGKTRYKETYETVSALIEKLNRARKVVITTNISEGRVEKTIRLK